MCLGPGALKVFNREQSEKGKELLAKALLLLGKLTYNSSLEEVNEALHARANYLTYTRGHFKYDIKLTEPSNATAS
jgi:hypothetical protein